MAARKSDSPVAPGVPLTAIKSMADRRRLSQACAEYRANRAAIAELEAVNKALMESDIRPIAERLEADKVLGDGWQMIRTVRTTKTIKPELLAQQGVALKVIEKATVTSTTTSYQVRDLKTQEEEG